jgi:hypothetical protein
MQQHLNGMTNDALDLHTLPIIRDVFKAKRGVKGVLEGMTLACIMIWIQFGLPFVLDPGELYTKANGDPSLVHLIQQIQHETARLTELLGIGISYMSWIYSQETNEGPSAIADIIGQIYYREMDAAMDPQQQLRNRSTTIATTASADSPNREDVLKLRFISSIDKNIIPQLRPKLADQFDVAGLYNMLYA